MTPNQTPLSEQVPEDFNQVIETMLNRYFAVEDRILADMEAKIARLKARAHTSGERG